MVSAIALMAASAAGAAAHAEAAAAAPAAAPADQAGQLSELVVTAERREVDLQKTPISATVLTAGDLEKKNINSVDALQFTTPSLTIQDTGENVLINLRGVGKSEGGVQAPSGILIYRDGVSTSPGGFLADEPYYDLSGVEVLRGPQGTLAGEDSTGGAIFIRSADPSLAGFSGWGEAQYGNYNDERLRGAVNIPLSDTVALRIATNLENRDSFYHLSGPWTGNPGDHHEADGRVSLLWQPTDALKVVWKNDYNFIDHGGSPAGPNTGSTSNLFNLSSDAHLKGMEEGYRSVLQIGYTFANGISLRSISGYQFGRTVYDLDFDGTASGPPTGPKIYTVRGNDRTVSEELNLVSPDRGPFTWVLGAVYQSEHETIPDRGFIESLLPGGTATVSEALQEGYSAPKTSWGVFGQGAYDLTDRLQLSVGARYSTSKLDLSDQTLVTFNGAVLINHPITDEHESDSKLTGKINLNYKVSDHGLVYAFVATGHKEGGINPVAALAAPAGTPAPLFKPEEVTDYELGWKDSFLGNHLRTQIDAYHYDYQNFQVAIFDPASALGQVENVTGKSTIQGVELQGEGAFGDFSFDLGAAFLDSKLGTFSAVDARNPALGLQSLTGRQQPNAPRFTFNAGAQYAFQLGDGATLTPRLDYGMISSRWATLFEVTPTDKLASQGLLNAELTYARPDNWRLTAYATNLTDLHYVSSLSLGSLANAGPPRQYGLRISKSF
ncbi:TonB-dependent receptor [Phenylobacterium sp.]|jgi:iron complex outermembrane receptor protein|uniref:TonB-dependent receptor n=1 Tax=Phenylobacterium sp. TaxID=1871053 RepID=UPI002D79BA86|nr:TonB-dependent receptor [Phenylobacterium sp.]